ncbi:hypothetical protein APUTEX25_000975 [Auxenochlorella protothecoides]|uniref:Ion transport domain-containing protein n=1 Tax=Auxenochlorella protothecoides TaxID=3075 RepID=A0A3M7KUS2_AUXPR|nr:hypothetical protein APUTEX25_000975 [Auxenochlorella protothecoides]|eukprot:RMZ52856.1 hypothetical protein APUTEX25_000975 [Auxenochlorella protothecoides]
MSRKSQSKSLLGGKSIVHRDESVAGPEHDYLAFYEVPNFDGLRWGSVSRTLKGDAATWHYYTDEHAPLGGNEGTPYVARTFLSLITCSSYLPPFSKGRQSTGTPARFKGRSIFGLPLIDPDDAFFRGWELFMTLIDLTYTAFLVPVSVAFDKVEGSGSFTWITYMDMVGSAIYVADMLLNFSSAFVVQWDLKHMLIMDGRHVASYYVLHGGFLVDLVATLPIIPEVIIAASPSANAPGLKAIYALRLLRLVRVVRLLKVVFGADLYKNPFSRLLMKYISAPALYLTYLLMAVFIIVNLLGCILLFVAEIEGEQNSWMAYASFTFNVVDANGWAQWVVAIYWASQTLTTVGYGDVVAVTVAEALISSVAMLLAILVFGFIVSVIGDLLTVSSLSAWRGQQIRQQLQGVEAWGKERHLGPDVMNKIRRYFIDIWAPHAGFDDAAYFYSLPVLLRGEIVSKMSGHTLQSSHLFSGLSSEVLGGLLCSAVPRRLVAGHDLYAEMSEGESFFILQEVRACSNCILWEFKSLDLQDIIRSDPRVLVHLCKAYIQYQDMLASRLQGRHAASSLGRLYKIRAELCRLLAKAERDAAAWEEEDVQKDPDEPGVPSDGEEQIQDTDQQLQKAEDEEAPDAPPHGDAGGALPAPGSTEAAPPLPPAAQLIMQGEPHLARLSFAHPGYTEDKAAQLRRSGFGNMPGGSGRYAV